MYGAIKLHKKPGARFNMDEWSLTIRLVVSPE
jgi:hypothetical protein